jgi:hypothetical protein
MGMRRDYAVQKWQEEVGINPARGEYAAALRELSQACFEAIKIIELERSGIRDGDGFWGGSDAFGYVTGELAGMCAKIDEVRIGAFKKRNERAMSDDTF